MQPRTRPIRPTRSAKAAAPEDERRCGCTREGRTSPPRKKDVDSSEGEKRTPPFDPVHASEALFGQSVVALEHVEHARNFVGDFAGENAAITESRAQHVADEAVYVHARHGGLERRKR